MVGTHPDFRAEDTITFEATSSGSRITYEAGLVMLADPAPVNDEQLTRIFAKLVDVVRAGLVPFFNPADES